MLVVAYQRPLYLPLPPCLEHSESTSRDVRLNANLLHFHGIEVQEEVVLIIKTYLVY